MEETFEMSPRCQAALKWLVDSGFLLFLTEGLCCNNEAHSWTNEEQPLFIVIQQIYQVFIHIYLSECEKLDIMFTRMNTSSNFSRSLELIRIWFSNVKVTEEFVC